MTTEPTRERAIIAAYRTHAGATQIQIVQLDDNDSGFGHRLAGPKHHNMSTKTLVERTLDAEDAREIRSILDAAFPPATAGDVTVYELRYGHPDDRPDTVALYASPYAAMDHGSAAFEAKHGRNVYGLTWRPDDDPGVWYLHVADMDGASVVGDWHIVAVTAPAAYTPAGGEQQ